MTPKQKMALQNFHNSELNISHDSAALRVLCFVKGTYTCIAKFSLSSSICIIEVENNYVWEHVRIKDFKIKKKKNKVP